MGGEGRVVWQVAVQSGRALLGLAAAGVGDEEGAVVGCQDVLMNEREGGGGLEKNAEME